MIRILLVEDDAEDAGLVREMLAEAPDGESIELTRARRLDEGLRRLEAARFDAILLDPGLPDAAGMVAVNAIREAAPETPLLILTWSDDRAFALQAMQRGAQDHLSKSRINGDTLNRAVRYALERHRSEARIREMAQIDSLTRLPNRSMFMDRLTQAVARCERDGGTLALLFIDVDDLKSVNDTQGHTAGDRLLRAVADRLRGSVRATDTVARLGGDEFTLVLSGLPRLEEAGPLVDKIRRSLALPYPADGHTARITASIGVSLCPEDGRDAETLIRHADAAMYGAKKQGGNAAVFFSPAMNERASRRLALADDLRQALDRNELDLVYQPLVDTASSRIVAAEGLLRWRHPRLGVVSPHEFLPVAEETEASLLIDDWVLRRSCAQLLAWRREGPAPSRVSVNLSARNVGDPALVESVAGALSDTGLEPGSLEIEVTESGIMRNEARTARFLHTVRGLGARVAIDDFGTGRSSLSFLRRLPFDTIKIDPSFVGDLPGNPSNAAIVTAIIAMGHGLDMTVVAEGVESPEQAAFLRRQRCDRSQGYYFARPLPADDLIAALRSEVAPARA